METAPNAPPSADIPLSNEVRTAVESYQTAFRNLLASRGIAEDAPETAEAQGCRLSVQITPDSSDGSIPVPIQLPVELEELLPVVYGSIPVVAERLELSTKEAVIIVKPSLPYDKPANPYEIRYGVVFKAKGREPGYATEIRFLFDKGEYRTGRALGSNRYDPLTREDRMVWTETPLQPSQIYAWRNTAFYAEHIPRTQTSIVNDRVTPLPPREMPMSFRLNTVNTFKPRTP